MTATDDKVTYEFKDGEYAQDFANLNLAPEKDESDDADDWDEEYENEWDDEESGDPRENAD